MFYSYSEIKMKKSTTKNQDSRLHKFKIYDEVIKFSTCTSHSCFAVNSYKTLSLVPRSKKSGPDSVSRYCKALFRGINVALFALPDTPRCKETCSDIIRFLLVTFKIETKTNLSSDGTAATTCERLNLHMVSTYLKQLSIQVIWITRSDKMMPNEQSRV